MISMGKEQRLCVIPARGGSKSIPNKNIHHFLGKPLICHSISSALNSNIFNKIIISSDSSEILNVCSAFSKRVTCLKRPDGISDDITMPDSAVTHAIKEAERMLGFMPAFTTFLQPTSPLRRTEDIINCNEILENSNYNSIVSVNKSHDFFWSNEKEGEYLPSYGKIRPRRQDYFQYVENGSIYVTRSKEFVKKNNRIVPESIIYELPIEYSYQIDSPLDLEWLNFVAEKLKYAQN